MQRIFSLDGTVAAAIWEALDGEANLASICEKLIDQFDVSSQQAEHDLIEFIDLLTEAGLIEEIQEES